MAAIDIKTTWDGAVFELEDVDLTQITNRDLIQQMIDAGVMLSEAELPAYNGGYNVRYSIIDKNGLLHPTDEVKALSKLGFCDGDEVRIISL